MYCTVLYTAKPVILPTSNCAWSDRHDKEVTFGILYFLNMYVRNHFHEYSTIASEWIKLEKLTYLTPSDTCTIFKPTDYSLLA